jgi:uncharacterized membrane protein
MLKGGTGDRLWTMTIMSPAVALVGLAAIWFLPWPAAASWPYIVASGPLRVGYNLFLVQIYGSGDFSETYPIARGSSPMLVALGAAVFAGERPDLLVLLGIVFVCGGIVSLACKGKDFGIASLPAALRRVLSLPPKASSMVSGFAQPVTRSPTRPGCRSSGMVQCRSSLTAKRWSTDANRSVVCRISSALRRRHAGRLWASLIAYAIVIWAMHHGPMGSVSALRQTSVVFAALVGRLALREQLRARRVTLCIVIACGAAGLGGAR